VAGAVEDRGAEGLVPAPDVIHAGRNGNLAAVVDVILELSSGCWWSCDLCRVVEHYDCLEALWNEVELAADGCTIECLLRNRSKVRRVRDWLKQTGRNQVAKLIVRRNEEVWSAAGGSLCLELREDIAERHLNGDDLDLREFLLELGELCSEGGAFSRAAGRAVSVPERYFALEAGCRWGIAPTGSGHDGKHRCNCSELPILSCHALVLLLARPPHQRGDA